MSPSPEAAYWRPSSVEEVPASRGGRRSAEPAQASGGYNFSSGPTCAVSHSVHVAVPVGGQDVSQPKYDPDLSEGSEESNGGGKRRKLAQFLERREVHWAVLSLTFVDLCLVIAALAAAVLDPEGGEMEYLTYTSIAVLWLFVVELLLRLVANGLSYFLRSPMHMFDALVVVTSLVLELAVHSAEERALGGLVVVLRLWRIVRIVGTTVSGTHLEFETQKAQLKARIAALEAEVLRLQQRLADNGISP